MPVEIKELIIRAVAEKGTPVPTPSPGATASSDVNEAIIETCVEQVLRILRKSRER